MNEIVAKRYARALIQIGEEDGNYELYGVELKGFEELLEASPELRDVMLNPIYEREIKKRAIRLVAEKLRLSPIVQNFLLLLVDKRRITALKHVVRCYQELVDEVAGRIRAQVFAAVPLEEPVQEVLKGKLETLTGKKVILEVAQDPDLIGGIVTKIGDKVYDGSVRTQLASLREILLKG